jgi:8-oxo-dGTP diphosphatase
VQQRADPDPGDVLPAARTAVAVAALVRDGHVLLGHRHPARRWYPDCWDLVGGHVEQDESPDRAVVRECREELDVHVLDPAPLSLVVHDPHLEMHAFRVTRWAGDVVNAAPQEHDDLRWFAAEELVGLTLAHPATLSCLLKTLRPDDHV